MGLHFPAILCCISQLAGLQVVCNQQQFCQVDPNISPLHDLSLQVRLETTSVPAISSQMYHCHVEDKLCWWWKNMTGCDLEI